MLDAFKTNGSSPPAFEPVPDRFVWLGLLFLLAPWLASILITLAVRR
jgi:hypothetical protein